jgi:hypothetical protein
VDRVILPVLDSRSNRTALRASAAQLYSRFPIPGDRALDLIGAGVDPGGNAIILL